MMFCRRSRYDLSYEISRRASLLRHDFGREHPSHERYLEEEAKILAGHPSFGEFNRKNPADYQKEKSSG